MIFPLENPIIVLSHTTNLVIWRLDLLATRQSIHLGESKQNGNTLVENKHFVFMTETTILDEQLHTYAFDRENLSKCLMW